MEMLWDFVVWLVSAIGLFCTYVYSRNLEIKGEPTASVLVFVVYFGILYILR
jgi:hypothetical protein